MKLSNVGFSIKRFTDDFSQFGSTNVKIYLFHGGLSTFPSVPNISEI